MDKVFITTHFIDNELHSFLIEGKEILAGVGNF